MQNTVTYHFPRAFRFHVLIIMYSSKQQTSVECEVGVTLTVKKWLGNMYSLLLLLRPHPFDFDSFKSQPHLEITTFFLRQSLRWEIKQECAEDGLRFNVNGT